MKPKVLLLVSDNNMGGVNSIIESFLKSKIADKFEFIVLTSNVNKKNNTWQPKIICCKSACTWKQLPKLLSFKLLNKSAKIVIQEHHYSQGFEINNVPSLSRFRLMLKLSYSLADRVVAVSQAQSRWMKQHKLVSSKKLVTIESCRTLEEFLTIPGKPIDHPLILGAYGRFCPQKGFDILIKAMQLIPEIPIKLLIGGEGADEAELKQLTQSINNVEFVGRIDRVSNFLQQCDAIVIPSRWEPYGLVCLEAKAAGKPVIASDIDGLSEQVQNCGILVPPQDPVKLAQAIASLSNHDLKSWGQAGRESVKNAWEDYLKKWESLLWELSDS